MAANVPDPPERMTAPAFLRRYCGTRARGELVHGDVVAMASERAAHNRLKTTALRALTDASAARPACETFTDGMSVVIDDTTVYEPNAALRCGARLDRNAIAYDDPVIVIKVTSPSSGSRDVHTKLAGYFSLLSAQHYLILDPERRVAVHLARTEGPALATSSLTGGALALDPPGLTLDLDALFAVLD